MAFSAPPGLSDEALLVLSGHTEALQQRKVRSKIRARSRDRSTARNADPVMRSLALKEAELSRRLSQAIDALLQ